MLIVYVVGLVDPDVLFVLLWFNPLKFLSPPERTCPMPFELAGIDLVVETLDELVARNPVPALILLCEPVREPVPLTTV